MRSVRKHETVTTLGVFCVLLATFGVGLDAAQAQRAKIKEEVGIDPRLNDKLPLDARLIDESGAPVRLQEFFTGQPVIVTPMYYRCPMLCGLALRGLVRCLKAMDMKPGRDFQIVSFSFDPRETPELAREKKESTLLEYDQSGAEEGWHFLTGDREQIDRLCEAIGFRTKFDEETGQYAHAAGIAVCTPEGRIARYFYGVEFSPRDLRLGLIEASREKIGTMTDQVLLYCYLYDPTTGKYGLAIMNIVRAAGVATFLALVTGVSWMLYREHAGKPDFTAAETATKTAGKAPRAGS